jgi:L-lactate dehydrogenase complex protein LldG
MLPYYLRVPHCKNRKYCVKQRTKRRTASVYAPVHICIAYTNQLLFEIADGINYLENKYRGELPSLISFASGPSRTADIEKTLVTGVHGPKEVFCFLVQKKS